MREKKPPTIIIRSWNIAKAKYKKHGEQCQKEA